MGALRQKKVSGMPLSYAIESASVIGLYKEYSTYFATNNSKFIDTL